MISRDVLASIDRRLERIKNKEISKEEILESLVRAKILNFDGTLCDHLKNYYEKE